MIVDLLKKAYLEEDEDAPYELAKIAQKDPAAVACHYYFHVCSMNNVLITPKLFFDTHNRLNDQYMPEVLAILGKLGTECASSVFEIYGEESEGGVRALLLNKGFIEDKAFTKFNYD